MALQRKRATVSGLVVLAALSVGGCATQGYVDEQIATVNTRIDGVDASVRQAAQAAQQADATARSATASAEQSNQRIDQVTARVDAIEQQLSRKRPRH